LFWKIAQRTPETVTPAIYPPNISATNFELFDFNNTTGTVSNPISLPSPSVEPLPVGIAWYRAYGVEFSPDGSYFYGGLNTTGEVFQYDLWAGGAAAIRNSARLVGKATAGSKVNIIGALQLATDGKIYIARDRLGIKPLFYSTINGFSFCSEISSISSLNRTTVVSITASTNSFEIDSKNLISLSNANLGILSCVYR